MNFRFRAKRKYSTSAGFVLSFGGKRGSDAPTMQPDTIGRCCALRWYIC